MKPLARLCMVATLAPAACGGPAGGRPAAPPKSEPGETAPQTKLRRVPGVSGVKALALAKDGSWALGADGALLYWGFVSTTYHDVVTKHDKPAPVELTKPRRLDVSGVQRLGADDWGCVLLSGGSVRCFGTLGDGFNGSVDRLAPTSISDVAGVELRVTGHYGCVLASEGTVTCWFGNPDESATRLHIEPMKIEGLTDVAAISGRDQTLYARMKDGTVRGWAVPIEKRCSKPGNACYPGAKCEPDGYCGKRLPLKTVEGLHDVLDVDGSVLGQHSCALSKDGSVWCWGANDVGQLGLGATSPKTDWVTAKAIPTKVPALANVTGIAVGTTSTCARIADGTVRCWGGNAAGQLGDGSTTNRSTPVSVAGLTGVSTIAAGSAHFCAVVTAGEVICWGACGAGQCG